MNKLIWIYGISGSGKTLLAWDILKNHDGYRWLNDNGLPCDQLARITLDYDTNGIVVSKNKPSKIELQHLLDKGIGIQLIECIEYLEGGE